MQLFGVDASHPGRVHLLVGFGFGASFSALFSQLGGGICTKGADIAADLVGKVEQGIPEDDPRNAAVVADLVGDNVGDVAGRGADLFESGADNIIGTMIVGLAFVPSYGWAAVLFPLFTEAIGAVAALLGIMVVRGTDRLDPLVSVNLGFLTSGLVSLLSFYVLATMVMNDVRLFYCLALGLGCAIAVSLLVQYYTGITQRPVKSIAEVIRVFKHVAEALRLQPPPELFEEIHAVGGTATRASAYRDTHPFGAAT